MMSIPFTQILLPNGRRREIIIDRSEEIEKMAHDIIDNGYRFEAEILTTGEVSFEVLKDMNDGPGILGSDICNNELGVGEVVDKLVKNAFEAMMAE